MKSNKTYNNEDKIKNINSLLEQSNITNLIDNIFLDSKEQSIPGYFNLRLSGRKMDLYLYIKAPSDLTNVFTIEDIKKEIETFGTFCTEQTDWGLVREIYTRVISFSEEVSELKIASGKNVMFNTPEHILIREDLTVDYSPVVLDNGKVNFHEIKSFIFLSKGEYIGDFVPMISGTDGMDLLGNVIPSPKKYINYYSLGENICRMNNKFYSNIDGVFKIIKNKLTVDPVLNIPEDVDYSTGDIEFAGDINVQKSIREGFSVKSNKNLYVGGVIEPVNITCESSIYVKHGIIGSPKYMIECIKSIYAIHVENANIRCDGQVAIKNCITNSNIYSLDRLLMDQEGSIIGGHYHFQNGIITGNIGNKQGIETYIKLGIDYKIEKKLEILQMTSDLLRKELEQIQKDVIYSDSIEEKYKLKDLFLKLKNRENSLNNYSRDLLCKLDKNDKSTLTIHGTIYPGTHIEICHATLIISKEISNAKFALNKQTGEIEPFFI